MLYVPRRFKYIIYIWLTLIFAAAYNFMYLIRELEIFSSILKIILTAVYFAVTYIWLPLYLKSMMWQITEEKIIFSRGIIISKTRCMHRNAVVAVSTLSTPLMRGAGICVKFHIALSGFIPILFSEKQNNEKHL